MLKLGERIVKTIATKHNLSIASVLSYNRLRDTKVNLAKQEIVYILSKEYDLTRLEVSKILKLKSTASIQNLLVNYCITNRLIVPNQHNHHFIKKYGSLFLVQDYQKLNLMTLKNVCPTP